MKSLPSARASGLYCFRFGVGASNMEVQLKASLSHTTQLKIVSQTHAPCNVGLSDACGLCAADASAVEMFHRTAPNELASYGELPASASVHLAINAAVA